MGSCSRWQSMTAISWQGGSSHKRVPLQRGISHGGTGRHGKLYRQWATVPSRRLQYTTANSSLLESSLKSVESQQTTSPPGMEPPGNRLPVGLATAWMVESTH